MKPTSPLSLLLFVRLVTSVPIVLPHQTLPSTSCGSEGCRELLLGPNTPPTKLTNPHFPTHQLSSSDPDIVIDNHPITPTSKSLPLRPLDAERPLTSAFLRSLAVPASPTTAQTKDKSWQALPSKPSSELPALRKAEMKKFLATLTEEDTESEVLDAGSAFDRTRERHCKDMQRKMLPEGYRRGTYVVREYGDVLVMGVVLLFLAIVICVEAVERCGSVRAVFDRKARKTHCRHGAIFLADTEKAPSKSFCLAPAHHYQKTPTSEITST